MPLGMSFPCAVILGSANLEQYAESTSDCKLGAVSQSVAQGLLALDQPGCLITTQNPGPSPDLSI